METAGKFDIDADRANINLGDHDKPLGSYFRKVGDEEGMRICSHGKKEFYFAS